MEKTKKVLEKTKRLLTSKEMLCAAYAYNCEKKKDEISCQNFLELWNSLLDDEKDKVVTIFFNLNNREMYNTLYSEKSQINRSEAYEKIRFHYLERLHKGVENETISNVFRKK